MLPVDLKPKLKFVVGEYLRNVPNVLETAFLREQSASSLTVKQT